MPFQLSNFWRRWLPRWMHLPVLWGFYASLAATIILLGIAVLYASEAMRFDVAEMARLAEGTVFHDRRGKELRAVSVPGRRLVKREEIPDFLVKALLAREDSRFFEHGGVDLRGLGRAVVRNVKDRAFTQGASTLTMQLARNTFDIRAKSLHRKLLEIALTLRVEAAYSKDEILTHYLNRIYFGSGAHGIEQAARIYFGKSTRELSQGECAMLIGIIRGPHIFSPIRNLDAATEQRDQVLKRMNSIGFIDDASVRAIASRRVRITSVEQREAQPSYAMQAINRELNRILAELDIRADGLKVRTTLDLAWQERLDHELARAVTAFEQHRAWQHPTATNHTIGSQPAYLQYAAITTETKTGATLALIGGRNFTHSRFDRTQSARDVGPAIRPFVAAAAAEKNVPARPDQPMQIANPVQPAEVERLARRCGLTGDMIQTEDLLRGWTAATPQEMSIALATFGNQGVRPKPYLIREIRDARGELVYRVKRQSTRAVSPAAASAAAAALMPPHARTRALTGATSSERDSWALRLGPGGATAIWIGFDKPETISPEPRLNALLDQLVRSLDN